MTQDSAKERLVLLVLGSIVNVSKLPPPRSIALPLSSQLPNLIFLGVKDCTKSYTNWLWDVPLSPKSVVKTIAM